MLNFILGAIAGACVGIIVMCAVAMMPSPLNDDADDHA